MTQSTVADRDFYRRSMIDYVLDDANRIRKSVAKTDQRKLDQYLTGVREVERRIQHSSASVELPGTGFQRPTGIPEDFDEHLRLMCDLMVLAFQTDSTRASTFMVTKEATDRKLSVARLHRRTPRTLPSRGRRGKEPQAP